MRVPKSTTIYSRQCAKHRVHILGPHPLRTFWLNSLRKTRRRTRTRARRTTAITRFTKTTATSATTLAQTNTDKTHASQLLLCFDFRSQFCSSMPALRLRSKIAEKDKHSHGQAQRENLRRQAYSLSFFPRWASSAAHKSLCSFLSCMWSTSDWTWH